MASFVRLMTVSLAVLFTAAVLPAADTTEDAATAGGSTATMEKTEPAQSESAQMSTEATEDQGKFVGLLEYTAIQNALGLDENQKKQIADVNGSLDESVPDPDALRELPIKQREMKLQTWEAKAQQLKEKLGQILTPEQDSRLKEIALQLRLKMRASSLLAEKKLAEKLSLSESQKQELQSLRLRIREQISKAREALVQSGQETKEVTTEKTEQFRKNFRELRDKAHQQALDILTPEQKEKLSELTGKAADINIDELLSEQSARVEKWASRWKKQRDVNGKEGQPEAADETAAEHQVGTTDEESEESETHEHEDDSMEDSESDHTGSGEKSD